MLDKAFLNELGKDVRDKYRKLIFDPAGGGKGAKDVYGKEMAGAIGDVGQQYSQGLGLVSDLVNQWHEQAQRISIG